MFFILLIIVIIILIVKINNLLRYPVYNVYYKDTLKRKIQENIKEHYYEK